MIIFDVTKCETHHPNANYKNLCRRLRSFVKVRVNKESLSSPGRLEDCQLLILGSPQRPFEDDEISALKDFVDRGGSLAIFASECGLQRSPKASNINELTRHFGICIENATVVRAVYHKYLHPKKVGKNDTFDVLRDFIH
jgi:hypothetical protein